MIVIGIILVLLGLVLGAFVVIGGLPGEPGTDVTFSVFNLTVETSVVVVFALGALTLLLLELGVLALRTGARKSSRRRAELQRLRRVEAEVQARQAAESQRNASTSTAAAPAAPAPFARREPDPSPRPAPTDAPPAGAATSTTDESDREHRATLTGDGPEDTDQADPASARSAEDSAADRTDGPATGPQPTGSTGSTASDGRTDRS